MFCSNCGKEVAVDAAFCPSCGYNLKQVPPTKWTPSVPLERKSPGTAAVLALILGFIGLLGIGHIYVGRLVRGIVVLIVGIISLLLTFLGLIASTEVGFALEMEGLRILGLFGILYLGLWIWQIFDAYDLAKEFNRTVQETGKEPW
jgi:TM2 domain-containing membrane protein YozV